MTSRPRLTAAIAASSVPTAQIPMLASTTPAIATASTGAKKSANAGIATSSAAARKASVASDLPSQIALRSHGASTRPSSAPPSRSGAHARARPSSAVKMIAIQSRP